MCQRLDHNTHGLCRELRWHAPSLRRRSTPVSPDYGQPMTPCREFFTATVKAGIPFSHIIKNILHCSNVYCLILCVAYTALAGEIPHESLGQVGRHYFWNLCKNNGRVMVTKDWTNVLSFGKSIWETQWKGIVTEQAEGATAACIWTTFKGSQQYFLCPMTVDH